MAKPKTDRKRTIKHFGHYLPFKWMWPGTEQGLEELYPNMPTLEEANHKVIALMRGASPAILSRALVDSLAFASWLKSDRKVVHVTKDLATALYHTKPAEITREDVESWEPIWFQFELGSPLPEFPEKEARTLATMLLFSTPDYGDEEGDKIVDTPTLRLYAINELRGFRIGLPDTDVVWCNWAMDKPINAENVATHEWGEPKHVEKDVIEMIPTSLLNVLLGFAANLMAYYKSESADFTLIQGRRKKDGHNEMPTIWRMGRKFKLRAKPEEPIRRQVEGGWTLSYRFWVTGHWRWQAHGPEHSLRKRIWIDPYEKGPDFAERVHEEGEREGG